MSGRLLRGVIWAAVCLGLAGCASEREQIVIETGYRGRAKLNPFLAGWRFLEEQGWGVEERHGVTALPGTDTVLVLPAEADQGGVAMARLEEWISAGGHLVYLLAGAERHLDDWGRQETDEEEETAAPGEREDVKDVKEVKESEEVKEPESADDPEEVEYPLLDSLGIRVMPRPLPTLGIMLEGRMLRLDMPPGLGVRIPRPQRRAPGWMHSTGPGPAGVASIPLGKGRVTVLGDARPWRSRHLGEHDHARFLWEVMRLHGEPRAAWFLRGTSISFFALLWRHGWMPLIGLACFVLFWLWRGIPRFGPLLPDPEPASREFAVHLAQSGAFLWSRAGASSLVEPFRRQIRQRLTQAEAGRGRIDLSEAQRDAIARACGLPPERILAALTGEIPRQRHRFTELLSDLQKIDSHCP